MSLLPLLRVILGLITTEINVAIDINNVTVISFPSCWKGFSFPLDGVTFAAFGWKYCDGVGLSSASLESGLVIIGGNLNA